MPTIETETSPEILETRADALVSSLRNMIAKGLDPQRIIELEDSRPSEHRDFLMLFLGLKAFSSFLHHTMECYQGYLQCFPASLNTGINLSFSSSAACNYQMLNKIIKNVTPEQLFPDPPSPAETYERYVEEELERRYQAVLDIKQGDDPQQVMSDFIFWVTGKNFGVEALLLGYPFEAGYLFGTYHQEMITKSQVLWGLAAQNNIWLNTDCPTSPAELCRETDCRNDFIKLAGIFGCDKGLFDYVTNHRNANVPGYRYSTVGDLTTEHEARVSALYDSSGLDEKLGRLLDEYINT